MRYVNEKNFKKNIDTKQKLLILSKCIVSSVLHHIPFFEVLNVPINEKGFLKEGQTNPHGKSAKEEGRILTKVMNDYITAIEENKTFLLGYCIYTVYDVYNKYKNKNSFLEFYIEKFDTSFMAYIISDAIYVSVSRQNFNKKRSDYIMALNRILYEISDTSFYQDFEDHVFCCLRENGINFEGDLFESDKI